MTLIELIETTGTIPNRFTTTRGVTMEYSSGKMSDGDYSAMYWQIVNGKKEHLWAIQYGATEEEAKEKMKAHLLAYGRNL